MADFPVLKSGFLSKYPLTDETCFPTRVLQFIDDSEQRFPVGRMYRRFSLSYHEIDGYDLGILRSFWESMKGQYDSTWRLFWNGTWIESCRFESDDFVYVEGPKPGRFHVNLRVRQMDR